MAVDKECSEISTDSLQRIKFANLQTQADNLQITETIINQLIKYKYLIISEVPEISAARTNVLYFAPLLDNLDVKKYGYESGHTTVGLSKFGNNNVSFYCNPICDDVDTSHLYASKQEAFMKAKSIFLPNLWPDEDLEGKFKESVKRISQILLKVSILVLTHIDYYSMKKVTKDYKYLSSLAETSNIHKSRIIHMHNVSTTERTERASTRSIIWHYDIGICASMVQDLQQISPPSSINKELNITSAINSGLVLMVDEKTRLHVSLKDGEVGFQIGMSGQILTDGEFVAPAHCVQLSEQFEPPGSKLSRSSFLLFVYPPPDTPLASPSDNISSIEEDCIDVIDSDVPRFKEVWKEGIYFSDFHEARVAHYAAVANSSSSTPEAN